MQLILKTAAALVVAFLLYLMLGPAPAAEAGVPGIDKIAHLGAFAVISVCFLVISPRSGLIAICLSALLLGGAVEVIQGFVGRDPSWLDFVFDAIGIALFWMAARFWRSRTPALFHR